MHQVIDAQPPSEQGIRGVVRLTARQLRSQRRVTLFLTIVPPLAIAAAIVFLWGRAIGGTDLAIMLSFYSFSLLGVTVGFHRLFTHRSFVATRALRTVLATAGSMAVEGSVVAWVATHRRHHAFADEFGDPHSPHLAKAAGLRGVLIGLWHAHVGWLFDADRTNPAEYAPDLLEDPSIMRVDRSFGRIVLASFLVPPALGFLITFSWHGMLTAFLWGSLVRILLVHHVTWSINSICHFYGKEAYKARDESRNVWPLAIPSFGESWHNNHHAFPWSARIGLRAWEIDPGWYALLGLRAIGLVRGLKQPTREQMLAKRILSQSD
ncbi:MAG: acyl-CoA desaturase [Actinomycetota bacterium]